ncbi:MAG TPA: MATE family efflux transporter [Firmicutes bacterium]|jgi:Na+-driven multidrug efflux pump|nr:MATE family efflux transporter [Bacillota bacterium]
MEKSLLRNFAKYVSLNILGMVGLSFYVLADTYFIAKALGATGIASLNLSIAVYGLLHGIGLMLGIGGATRFSILKAQRKDNKAAQVFSTSIKLGLVAGVLLAIIGLFGSKHLALALGANGFTLPMTKIYLMTILTFAPFFIVNNIVITFVRNDNNPNLSMLAMLAGSFSNIILDYVFMFPLKMGMFGAAFATGLAPVISICLLLLHFIKNKNMITALKEKIVWPLVPDLSALGLPAFVVEISSSVVLITFNWVILGLEGNLGVAAYGVIANLAFVGVAIFTGLAQGVQPLASHYYGLGDDVKVEKIRNLAMLASVFMAIAIYSGVLFSTDNIIGLFNSENNTEIVRIAGTGLRIYFLGFFFLGINIVTTIFLGAIEKAREAFIISIARGFIIIVPLVLVFSRIWGMIGVWSAFVVSELIVMIMAIYFAAAKGRLLRSKHGAHQESALG